MFSCDYNGWADVPEEEREGLEAFESVRPPTAAVSTASLVVESASPALIPRRQLAAHRTLQRKAA